MRTIHIEVPRRIVDRLKREAKKAFPKETLCYFIGQDAGDQIAIEDLWFPEDVSEFATTGSVIFQEVWAIDAREYAKENEASVVGYAHSHPYRFTDEAPPGGGITPSEGDFRWGWGGISAICAIRESGGGKLTARVRWYPPAHPVEAKIITERCRFVVEADF